MADWQNIRVTVALGDPELDNSGTCEAFTTGETWNGWAVPYFTAAEAQKVADWSQLVARRSVDPDAQDKVRWDSEAAAFVLENHACLLYTSPSPRDRTRYRMP